MNQAPGCVPATNWIKYTIFITDIREEEQKYQDASTEIWMEPNIKMQTCEDLFTVNKYEPLAHTKRCEKKLQFWYTLLSSWENFEISCWELFY